MDMEELRWTVHPLLDEPRAKSGLLLAIVLGLSAVISISFGGGGYGFLAFGLLTASLSRYFLPTRYKLSTTGVRVSHLGVRRQVSWAQVRRFSVHPDGIFLSPFDRPNRLDAFRGHFIRFGENREDVIRFVQTQLPHGSSQSLV